MKPLTGTHALVVTIYLFEADKTKDLELLVLEQQLHLTVVSQLNLIANGNVLRLNYTLGCMALYVYVASTYTCSNLRWCACVWVGGLVGELSQRQVCLKITHG